MRLILSISETPLLFWVLFRMSLCTFVLSHSISIRCYITNAKHSQNPPASHILYSSMNFRLALKTHNTGPKPIIFTNKFPRHHAKRPLHTGQVKFKLLPASVVPRMFTLKGGRTLDMMLHEAHNQVTYHSSQPLGVLNSRLSKCIYNKKLKLTTI